MDVTSRGKPIQPLSTPCCSLGRSYIGYPTATVSVPGCMRTRIIATVECEYGAVRLISPCGASGGKTIKKIVGC